MSSVVKVGQIGLGYWGPNLLRNFLAIPDAKVTWLADLDSGRLEETDFRENGVRITTQYQELLNATDVDAVIVATPAKTHYPIVREALQLGKHVFVEKPLALKSSECEELIQLAEKKRLTLMVGHTFLYNAAVRRLKEFIDTAELGNILYLYSQRLNLGRVRQDINALWNFAPHDVSILLYLLERTPTQVTAQGFNYIYADIADVVFMTLEFPGKVAAHVHISWLDPQKVRRMTVVGSRKMMVYDDTSPDAKLVLYDKGVDKVPTTESPRDFHSFAEFQLLLRSGDVVIPALKFPEPLRIECAHFIDAIRNNQQPLTDGVHGLSVVRVLEAAQRSMDANGTPERV